MSSRVKIIFGDELETRKETCTKRIEKSIQRYTELINTMNTQVRSTSSQLLSSRQSTLEQARKSTNSEQASTHRLYAQKSTSRIRNEDLTDVTPVIPEDPFHPTNFTIVPRIQTRPRYAHYVGEPRYHYHDEDWWIHAKLHELPHMLNQLKKESRMERESLELKQQQYKLATRKPLPARNFSDDLPEIRFNSKTPFFLASTSKPSHSIPANHQELLSFIINNCPLLKEVAKNVLSRKNITNLMHEFFRALDQHAVLLDKRIFRLKKEQRRAVGRSWSEIIKQIDSDERERDLCRRKANELHTAMLRDDPLHHPARTTKTNMGNELNQLRLLHTIFDH